MRAQIIPMNPALVRLPELESLSARLRFARERAQYASPRAAARAFGWNENTYKSHENGMRAPRHADLETVLRRYARGFKVPWEWLATGKSGDIPTSIDVVSYVGAGAEVYPFDEPFDEIEPPPDCPPGAFAVVVRGDSQLPVFSDGDVLICAPLAHPDDALWKRAIVDLEDGRRLLKQVTPGRLGYTLLSANGAPIPDVRVIQAARIVWHRPA